MPLCPSPPKIIAEPLERRTLFSTSFLNVNISKLVGNQAEGSITVDRADPTKLFALSNIEVGDGLMAATSSDGGATWSNRLIANDTDGLPPACCDPSASFDSFGNLFVSYLNADDNQVIVLLSTDAGASFSQIGSYSGDVDQPTITTGPGGVWLTFFKGSGIVVTGAEVGGLNTVGTFAPLQKVKGSGDANFGDIAVSSTGSVMVTYESQGGGTNATLKVNVDPDGLGALPFGKPIVATSAHVGYFDFIDAMPNRGIDAEAGLAFDRSGGPYNGRVYMVYTDAIPPTSENTDIFLRYSDNGGSVWSVPIKVNDDVGVNSQFLPRISLDNTTGQVAVGWYDARNDLGAGSVGDTDQLSDNDAEYYAAVITPQANGVIVSTNHQISAGASNAESANNSIDLGDYTGLDFYNGTIHPEWFDNSNSTGDNPAGTQKTLDVYTAAVNASSIATGGQLALGGLTTPAGPLAALTFTSGLNKGFVKTGTSYTVSVSYFDANVVSLASLGSTNLSVTGPNGFIAQATYVKSRVKKNGLVLATYKVINPSGKWTAALAGEYNITLLSGQVIDGLNQPAVSGVLGNFVVATGVTGARTGGNGHRGGGDPDAH